MSDFAFLGWGIFLAGMLAIVTAWSLKDEAGRLDREIKELRGRVERLEVRNDE